MDETGEQPRKRRRRAPSPGLASAVGGILVGFDYQVFRATKPPAELVEAGKPVRGLSGEDGDLVDIDAPTVEPSSGDGVSPVPGRPKRTQPRV